ncbi:MAG TPA: hypothetical protein EYP57_07820 [Thermodesulfobacteriaceae bacterium]|nr:hypothetical protein [Thermodesulfobacteriaceae bacterium]
MRSKFLISFICLIAIIGFACSAWAIKAEFHGSMLNAIGTSDNAKVFSHPVKSGKTNYFSYSENYPITSPLPQGVRPPHYLNTYGQKSIKVFNSDIDRTSAQWGITKARLRFDLGTDDELAKVVYSFEVGGINWGDSNKGFGLSGDGVNVETCFAYLQFQMPFMNNMFGKKHMVRAGLQPNKVNQWLWKETATGFSYYGKSDSLKWQASWLRSENPGTKFNMFDSANKDDYLLAKVNWDMMPEFSVGGFVVYGALGEEPTSHGDMYNDTTYYIGVTPKIQVGAFFGNLDFIYQGGSISFKNDGGKYKSLDHSAYLGNLTLGMKVLDTLKISVNGLYVSGDDDPWDGDAENFNSIDTDAEIGIIFFKDSYTASADRAFSDAPYIQDKGLINLALQGDWQVTKANNLRAAVRYLMTAEDLEWTNGLVNQKDDELGWEIDLWYTYKYNKNLSFRVEGAYLFAGDAAKGLVLSAPNPNDPLDLTPGDDMYYLGAGANFKF